MALSTSSLHVVWAVLIWYLSISVALVHGAVEEASVLRAPAAATTSNARNPESTVELVFQAIERRLCYDEWPQPSLVQYGFACEDSQNRRETEDRMLLGSKPQEVGFCDFTTFVTTYRLGSTVSDTVQTFGNFYATCYFPSCDDSCGHPFTATTSLSIKGTVNGVYGALVSSVPPRPKPDAICIENDKGRAAPGTHTERGPSPLSNTSHTAHPTPVHTQGEDGGPDRYGSPHDYASDKEDVGAFRIDRLLLFRGHVRVQSPGPVSNLGLEDGYFEFPLYANNLDYTFPPKLTPVSKAEAAAERVFYPFKATMTFNRRGPQQQY